MNKNDIAEIKRYRNLTLESGRGETYSNGRPTLYGHSTYGRGSVLAGRPRREWLEDWDDIETARAELKAAGIRYRDLCDAGGSTHIPVDVITTGLPDGEI
ncbi:MAG: hypothetical protein J0M04_06050 [Verrucomicrobia bacterium]|nr:hypothetical protein [Verrucomicrobiota bacterium]